MFGYVSKTCAVYMVVLLTSVPLLGHGQDSVPIQGRPHAAKLGVQGGHHGHHQLPQWGGVARRRRRSCDVTVMWDVLLQYSSVGRSCNLQVIIKGHHKSSMHCGKSLCEIKGRTKVAFVSYFFVLFLHIHNPKLS